MAGNQGARHGVDWGRVGPTPAQQRSRGLGNSDAEAAELQRAVPGVARQQDSRVPSGPFPGLETESAIPLSRVRDESSGVLTRERDARTYEAQSRREVAIPGVPRVQPVGLMSVKTVDAFFQGLPSESIQHLAQSGSARVTESNLVAGSTITITTATVPDKYVWAITDVQFYALSPSKQLEGPLIPLSVEQLVGFMRFELTAGQRQPFRTANTLVNPYASSSSVATENTGWPFVSLTPAGPRGTFALYAKSNQPVQVEVKIDVVPRFWITVVGARFTGFSLPEVSWAEVLRRQQVSF